MNTMPTKTQPKRRVTLTLAPEALDTGARGGSRSAACRAFHVR